MTKTPEKSEREIISNYKNEAGFKQEIPFKAPIKSQVKFGHAEMVRNILCIPRVKSQHWHTKWSIGVSQLHEWAKAHAGGTVHCSKRTVLKHVAGLTQILFCEH